MLEERGSGDRTGGGGELGGFAVGGVDSESLGVLRRTKEEWFH